jgi:hypothetical protein
MENISQLSVSSEQYERLLTAQAVAVSLYRGGSALFSKLARIGTVEECEDYVNTPSLLIVLEGTEYLGSEGVLVSDLIPPDRQEK